MIETLRISGYTCFILAAIMLVISVVLFFRFRIKDVIYELSGKARTDLTSKMISGYNVTGTLRRQDSPTSGSIKSNSPASGQISKITAPTTSGIKARKVSKKSGNASSQLGFNIIKEIALVHTNERIS